MITKIINIIIYLALYPLFILSCMLKKDKNIWIFSSWQGQGLTDNPKAFHDYLIENHAYSGSLRTIWITKNRSIIGEFLHLEVYYAYSFWGIYYQCKAGVVIYSDSIVEGFFEHCICPSTFQVQTWHGVPLKKVRNDVYMRGPGVLKFLLENLFPFRYDNPDIILHTAKKSSHLIANAFGVEEHKVYPIGYPRNDVLLEARGHLSGMPIKFLYAPTYRNNGLGNPMSAVFLKQLGELLDDHSATLDLKLHPSDVSTVDSSILPAAVNVLEQKDDLNKILPKYNVLISDYSGCLIDYLLLDRPIVLYPFDYLKYQKEHGLYSHYDFFLSHCPTAYDETELLNIISEMLKSVVARRPDILKKNFHDNFDSASSERLFNVIQSSL